MIGSKNSTLLPRTARKIKEFRVDRKHTQKELAERSGIKESIMRGYELGDRNPKPEVLDWIARALKVRPEYLSTPEFKRSLEFTYAPLESNEAYGYTVTMINGQPAIAPGERTAGIAFRRLLYDWSDKKEKLKAGEVSPEEYKEWKHTYEGDATWINTPDGKNPWTGK